MGDEWAPIDLDDEDAIDESAYENQKDAVLFMIDVSKSMLTVHNSDDKENEDHLFKDKSPARVALECAVDLLRSKIISNPKDLVGVLLYGTKATKVPGNYRNLYYLLELDEPDAPRMKSLKMLLEDEREFNKIFDSYEGSDLSMANAFFCVNQVFNAAAAKFNSKRLFVVTDNDTPGDKDALKQARTRVGDLEDLGIRVEPFYIRYSDKPFDPSIFWEEIVYRDDMDEEDAQISTDALVRFQDLSNAIQSKEVARRALFQIKLEIGPGLQIGVKGFLPMKHQTLLRTAYVYVKGERPQLVKSEGAIVDRVTSKPLLPEETQKGFQVASERVGLRDEDFRKLRIFGEPIIRIVGFKEQSTLPVWENLRPPYFLYPTEGPFVGSTRTYAALHRKLQSSKKYGVVWAILRRNSPAAYYALYPSNVNDTPQGLYLIQLPFADDVRANPKAGPIPSEIHETLYNDLSDIVKSLKRSKGYLADSFSNPSLQWQYKILEAVALDQEVPDMEDHVDTTLPNYRAIHKRTGALSYEFIRELDAICPTNDHVGPLGKRSAENTSHTAKKPKTDEELVADEVIRESNRKGQLKDFKADQLKTWLKAKDVSISGLKKDGLIGAVESYLEKQ